MSASALFPKSTPTGAAGRLGRPRHYPAVAPFLRAHFALRRLEIEDMFASARQEASMAEDCLRQLRELRRVAHACHLE